MLNIIKGKLLFSVVLIWGMACGVFAYPDGAPERACYRMIPRHTHPFTGRAIRAQPSTVKAPYNITLSRSLWNPDVPITVTIHGGAPFKGFMLMAAEDSLMDMPTGKFFANGATDVKTMFCSFPNDAATHTDSKWKSHITVDWYAPAFTSADHMQFIATVVTNRSTVWTNIKSVFLQADPAVSEAAEGGMMPGGFGGAGGAGGVDQWGYPISTTPGYGIWGRGTGGFDGGVTYGYTTVAPDTPARSEAAASRREMGSRAGSSRSRAGGSRQNARSRSESTTQAPSQGERWGEGRSRNNGWGEMGGSRGGEGGRGRGSGADGRRGSGAGGWGEGRRSGGGGGGGRGGRGGRGRGRGSGGQWGAGEGMGGGGGAGGGAGEGGAGGGAGAGAGGAGAGAGWGGDAGWGAGGGAGGFGGGEGAMNRRFQQMFMQWLMGGGQNSGGGGAGGGLGGGGNAGGMNGFSNMFWKK
ncbi:glycine-rich cell wall structural protein-like isoform X2 [Pecten maximus]|uniref:glycine-rich cell wall structural protein-like isoform X2 n=1 Tax=Pecten maximus TaxID=6579 RepID=UPI0014585246|nr:glycine-rich cell wall structural protein-like isoform X2 [Pecten maximus]